MSMFFADGLVKNHPLGFCPHVFPILPMQILLACFIELAWTADFDDFERQNQTKVGQI